jgi:predicted PurR-regulated permease PerM
MDRNASSRIYAVVFVTTASIAVGLLSFRILRPFLAAIAWAVVLAIAFQKPSRVLKRRLPWPHSLAPGLLTFGIALLILLPASLIGVALVSQTIDIAGQVNTKLAEEHVSSFSDIVALPIVANALDRIQEMAGITPDDFQRFAQGFATRASSILAAISARLVLGAFDVLLTFGATIFLLFFLFRDEGG